jgi:hypothetical protein
MGFMQTDFFENGNYIKELILSNDAKRRLELIANKISGFPIRQNWFNYTLVPKKIINIVYDKPEYLLAESCFMADLYGEVSPFPSFAILVKGTDSLPLFYLSEFSCEGESLAPRELKNLSSDKSLKLGDYMNSFIEYGYKIDEPISSRLFRVKRNGHYYNDYFISEVNVNYFANKYEIIDGISGKGPLARLAEIHPYLPTLELGKI